MVFNRLKRAAVGSRIGLLGLGVALASPGTLLADGNALRFDGVDDYVTMGDVLGQSEVTVSLWFRKSGPGLGASTGAGGFTGIPLVSKGRGENDNSTLDCNYFFGIDSATGALGADFEEGAEGKSPGLNHPVVGTTVIQEGAWYHAALTYDGAEWRIYLNGKLEAKLYTGQPLRADSIQHFGFGRALNSQGAAAGAFEGEMDEVSVWSAALDEAQILDLMFANPVPDDASLDGYWKLDQATGSTATDETGSFDGTLLAFGAESWVASGFERASVSLPPVSLQARLTGLDEVTLTWSNLYDTTSRLVVERTIKGAENWAEVATIAAGSSGYVDSGVSRAVEFQYRVRPEGITATSSYAVVSTGSTEGYRVSKFRYGVNGYYNTQDISLQESGGVGPDGTWNDSTIYTDRNAGDEHIALVQFLDLVGEEGSKIPAGVEIQKATLRLWVGGGNNRTNNALALHRMLAPWNQNSSWNSMGNGISTDDVEAAAAPDATYDSFTSNNAWSEWDVTSTLQAIVDGAAANNGWALRNSGGDGFGFVCSETTSEMMRPELVVEYKVEDLPMAPVDFVANYVSSVGVSLSWSDLAANETSYYIERASNVSGPWDQIANLPANSESYTDTSVGDGATYFYRVAAENVSGGALTDAIGLRTGNVDSGLEFDGVDDYVTMGNSLGMSELTISLWFKKTGAGRTGGTGVGGITAVPLVSKGRGESDGSTLDCNYFFGIIGTTGTLGADFEEGGEGPQPGLNHPAAGVTPIEEDRWYHAAVSYDGDTWKLYLNGSLESETYVGRPLRFDSIQHFGLGAAMNSSGATAGAFEGQMDDVSLWSRALDLDEIRSLMDSSPASSASGLAGYWKLDELSGDVAVDEANTNDGLLVNMSNEDWVILDRSADSIVFAPESLVAANVAHGKVELTWSDVTSNESGFLVERSASPTGPWSELATLASNTELHADSGLETGRDYYYRVRPTDSLSYSNIARAKAGTRAALLTATFRHGENDYNGTRDVAIRQSKAPGPDGSWNAAEVYTDNNSATDEDQILIRFGDVFGPASNQVDPTAVVHKATLRLWVGGGNNRTNATVNLHRMLKDWSEASSWNSMIDGITADDVEAIASAEDSKAGVPLVNEWSEWDVTESLRAYQADTNGNFGWTLLNTGSDGFGIWSREAPVLLHRPELVIEYSDGQTPVAAGSLSAVPVSESSIRLRWIDSSNEERYAIERSASPEGPWETIAANVPSGETQFSDTGLEAATSYFYRVIAFNAFGGSISAIGGAQTDDRPYGLRTLSFRNGQNGYEGNLDIGIGQTDPTNVNRSQIMWVDNNSATDESQVLLRFDEIFGAEAGRIPVDTNIERAYIRIYVSDVTNVQSNSPMHFHQMLADWDETSSWDAVTWGGNGVDDDGVDARIQPDSVAQFSTNDKYYDIDVTPSFRRWLAGEENFGWVIATYASNGYGYSSSLSESIEQRPELVVVFDTDPSNFYPEVSAVVSPLPDATDVAEPATIDFEVSDANGDSMDIELYGRKIRDFGTEEDFSVVLLPDTQFYSAEMNGAVKEIFSSQTDWIIENREALNIAFVLHMGDITQNGDVKNSGDSNEDEWINAANAMYALEDPVRTGLEEGIPYGVAVGNHDQEPIWDPNGTTTFYNQYFGKEHFAGKSYYGDHYGTNNDNYYQLYTVGSFKFLAISLEYRASVDPGVLEWADQLIKSYPDRRAIITTHHMVNTGNPASWSPYGEAIYETLKDNPNLGLLLGGHIHGEGRRTDEYNGNVVHALLQDYQGYTNGGNGYLRVLTFSPSRNKIFATTYSPWVDAYEEDADSEFELDYDLGADLADPELLASYDDVASGSRLSWNWEELKAGSQYEWFVRLNDGRKVRTSDRYLFTAAGATYSSWRDGTFKPEDVGTDRDADFDEDGFNNFYEFVFNSDPRSGNGAHMPVVTLGEGDTKVRYTRASDTGLTWSYLVSEDMISWHAPEEGQLELNETITDNGDGTETVDIVVTTERKTVFWKITIEE